MPGTAETVAGGGGWRRTRGEPSLREVWGSIPVTGVGWRRVFAFIGPGYLVSVGYMDPGQLGHLARRRLEVRLHAAVHHPDVEPHGDPAAGALRAPRHRHGPRPRPGLPRLVLQTGQLRAVAVGGDSHHRPRPRRGDRHGHRPEAAVRHSARIGVLITALDVFLILCLQNQGFRWLEAFVIATSGRDRRLLRRADRRSADPDWRQVILGFVPTVEIVTNPEMLYIAIGIIGATVMPHNLYLHSSIVQTRAYPRDRRRQARRDQMGDDGLDHRADAGAVRQRLDPDRRRRDLPRAAAIPTSPRSARRTSCCRRCSGSASPRRCSRSRCSASGLNSTVTATLAGQIVMEGFLHLRLPAGRGG